MSTHGWSTLYARLYVYTYVCVCVYVQVGTLDSLMQLSDDLVRIDMLVENMVRKIEKQYAEVAGEGSETLKVGQGSTAAVE